MKLRCSLAKAEWKLASLRRFRLRSFVCLDLVVIIFLTFFHENVQQLVRTVVVAQLAERSHPIPEIPRLESSHRQIFILNIVYCQLY